VKFCNTFSAYHQKRVTSWYAPAPHILFLKKLSQIFVKSNQSLNFAYFHLESTAMYNNQGDRKQYNKQFQEAASFKKATNDTQYFWDLVNRNKNSGYPQQKKNNKQEEKILFGKKHGESTEKGVIDDSIPVERSGPGSEEVGILQSFSELAGTVPSYVIENISLMRYERPTPIQKHSVPLGLAGLDLMCCAQTVSFILFLFIQLHL
jgi:hypothetical protein